MAMEECHLCGEPHELRQSHIWSQFAYKRYAADQGKGGRFADLFKSRLSNVQYTESWFCDQCEQRFGEAAAGSLCARIDKAQARFSRTTKASFGLSRQFLGEL